MVSSRAAVDAMKLCTVGVEDALVMMRVLVWVCTDDSVPASDNEQKTNQCQFSSNSGRKERTPRQVQTYPHKHDNFPSTHTPNRMPTLSTTLSRPGTQTMVWWEKTRLAVTLAIVSGWGCGRGREFFEIDSYDWFGG